ncbi:MAG: SDR family oxidoreductase [Bacteriovoracaceae bacterium]|nr:SDR family oxidoreductase [Bacteriovoracaceae bacterium]
MHKSTNWNILITGAAGFIGTSLVKMLIQKDMPFKSVIGTDVRPQIPITHHKYHFIHLDICDPDLGQFFKKHQITHVVHLASIVTPGKKSNREFEYKVDVLGTQNVLKACVENNVQQIILTSSGAAYGYHADNPDWLSENDAIRGNYEFPYSHHKKLVEEELVRYQKSSPQLKQLILRPGTILGEKVNNQITDLFKKKVIIGIKGSKSPFVFIWDEDVVEIIYQGLIQEKAGAYNLAGDGCVSLKEISSLLKKNYLPIPATALKFALSVLKKFHLTQYGPEQINFLQFRPVLDNKKLKTEFGFTPRFSSKECFLEYQKHSSL